MLKRLFDFLIAFFLLLIFSPVFLILIGTVYCCLGPPVFFIQNRPGRHGQLFKMIKFRTMRQPKEGENPLLTDKTRLTKLGRFLRKTSLDELPELWNVLKGDMSLVGPRPLLEKYLPLYSDFEYRRHEVRPGITGWAQINGRNAISWREKFNYDVWYVDNKSFLLDLKILFLTFHKVLSKQDISHPNEATMHEFKGHKGMTHEK